MLTSLFTGISGLKANMSAMSVIGDNLANMNTIGYKASRTSFADLLAQSIGGGNGTNQVGLGVMLSDVTPIFKQGSLESTGNGTDLAIEGNGFFVLRDTAGTSYYTRAGQFNFDKDGYMVNPEGLKVRGYMADSLGNLGSTVEDIQLSYSPVPPMATSSIDMVANLNSDAVIPGVFDITDPSNTSNFSSAMSVFDSLGNSHQVATYFRKDTVAPGGNTWQWFAVVNAADSQSGVTEIQAQGTVDFTNTGALNSESAITYSAGGFNFAGSPAQAQQIAIDFGVSIAEGSTGLDGLTQYAQASSVFSQSQVGYTVGSLQSVFVDQSGNLVGAFSNGITRPMAQLVMGSFASPENLKKNGGNMFLETVSSGQALVGVSGTSGLGNIHSNALELSTVDISEEFVRMITAQRGFQANSRVITTTDDMLAELVNLKR